MPFRGRFRFFYRFQSGQLQIFLWSYAAIKDGDLPLDNIPTAKSDGYRNRFICPVMQKSHQLPRAVSEDSCSLINNHLVLKT